MSTPEVFNERALITAERLEKLSDSLSLTNIGSACVYATGSIAREEANRHSDLDIFIVDTADVSRGELMMSQLDATLLKADLIRASRDAGFPPFTRDGIHLQMHSLADIVRRTGSPQDDATNTFTARLLLILESKVIANEPAHRRASQQVIEHYWTDYPQNRETFIPVFLVNDIVRYWKTLCLNYESGRLGGMPSGYTAETWKQRNQLRNIKLKFSRLWMCHSTIAFLLWKSAYNRSVTPEDISEMIRLSPYERMKAIREPGGSQFSQVSKAISSYAWFLERFGGSRDESYEILRDKDSWIDARSRGAQFAEDMSELLSALGQESALFRFLLV